MDLQTVLVAILFSLRVPMHSDAHDVTPSYVLEPQTLMAADRPPDRPHIARGIRFFITTQAASGDGPHEGMTAVC